MGGAESVQTNEKHNGFRIYKLIPNGPLEKANLKIIDDFIIPPEELFLKKIPFCDWVKEKAEQTIKLQIYSLSKRAIKEIEIKVNTNSTKKSPSCFKSKRQFFCKGKTWFNSI